MLNNPQVEQRQLFFILIWMAALLIFSYSWVPGGLDVDSCHYGVVSKEIMRTNKWLALYDPIDRAPFYYHFPLSLWVTAAVFKLFGVSVFTAKLFSLVSGIALVAVIFYLGKWLKNQWVGFFAGMSFLMTNHIVRIIRKCRLDIPLSLFISLAIFSFALAQRRSRRYYLLFGLFSCLAILTKDVSGLAPLAIALIYFLISARWKEIFHPLFILGVFLTIGPVFAWIWLDQKTLFSPWLNCNFLHLLKCDRLNVAWYYYIWVLITKYFYFLPFTLYGGYLAVKEARKYKKNEFYLLVTWAAIFPIAFSFGKQKLHYLILPVYPAASLLAAMTFDKILSDAVKRRLASGLRYILIVVTAIVLCLPFNMRGRRFVEAIHIAPTLDQVLKQLPAYELIVYKQDQASLLFYSQVLTRVTNILYKEDLERDLSADSAKVTLCYISEKDFMELDPAVRQNYRAVLKYKDRIIIINRKYSEATITLP